MRCDADPNSAPNGPNGPASGPNGLAYYFDEVRLSPTQRSHSAAATNIWHCCAVPLAAHLSTAECVSRVAVWHHVHAVAVVGGRERAQPVHVVGRCRQLGHSSGRHSAHGGGRSGSADSRVACSTRLLEHRPGLARRNMRVSHTTLHPASAAAVRCVCAVQARSEWS